MDGFFEWREESLRFRFGAQPEKARQAAIACGAFVADDEDEQVDDELISCLNCALRRWGVDDFECKRR